MKTVILVHGTGGNDKDYFWFADIQQHLEAHGYKVWWPLLPNADKPNLQDALSFLSSNMPDLDEHSVIIGHSSACPLILSLLERLEKPVAKAVLVSGFYQDINDEGYSPLMLQDSYNWQKIKAKAKEIYLLNSDNDPWGCTDQQARPAAQQLQAPLIVMFGQGHMGSGTFNQPYKKLPLVKQLVGIA
jgi:predicted alpha/beta hydrolase family esterase